jgi:hypothetical protein
MLTVQFPERGQREGYALGVARTGWYRGRNADLFSHGGGGFGFLSDLWWLPELKLGIAVLTNNSDHQLQGSLALQILDELVHQPGPYYDRLAALPKKTPVKEGDGHWRPPAHLVADIADRALPSNPAGWQSYLGEYLPTYWNVLNVFSPPSRVYKLNGSLYFDESDEGEVIAHRLYEVEPGLFFTGSGETLDLRSTPPTYRNIKLTRVGSGPPPAAWGVLAACGLVMLSTLLALPARLIRRRLLKRRAQADSPAPEGSAAVNSLTIAAGLCGLACTGLLVSMPRLIYSGFLGWLDLPLWLKLLMHAPLGLAVCAAALALLAVPVWRQGWWVRGQRWRYYALVAAALAETALLAGWRLIGIG